MNAAMQSTIIRQKIEQAEQVIYAATIDKRVADKCGDNDMAAKAVELAKKWEMMRDQFESILKELEPVKAKEDANG